MKKIHLLILKSFIRPFIVTFFIVMFVLLMLFLFKYIDDMIGKGFQWYTILELMMYASFTNVAMALPLSVLLSSIMTYGSLGENYELVAIKSAGISLSRAMYPMMITVTLLSIGAFVFSDYMLPIANFKYYSLLYDVRQQKAAFLIQERVFNNSVPGYSIRVNKKDPDGQTLHDLMIYNKDQSTGNMNVVIAKQGIMYRTPDDMQLVLKLKDGVRYEEKPGEPAYDMRQRSIRTRFTSSENRFDLSSFKMHRTSDNEWKSVMQMMNLKQLTISQDSVRRTLVKTESGNYRLIMPYVKYFSVPGKSDSVKRFLPARQAALSVTKGSENVTALSSALREATSVRDMLKGISDSYKEESKTIRKYSIEYQKKFTLSAACLVLFLIGAPLGAIIRKGGLGLPVVVAVIFFLIYYIIATIGEKSVKEGGLSPAVGMWVSIVVLTPIGIFLSYKAATDSVLFDVEVYKKLMQKLTRLIPRKLLQNKARLG